MAVLPPSSGRWNRAILELDSCWTTEDLQFLRRAWLVISWWMNSRVSVYHLSWDLEWYGQNLLSWPMPDLPMKVNDAWYLYRIPGMGSAFIRHITNYLSCYIAVHLLGYWCTVSSDDCNGQVRVNCLLPKHSFVYPYMDQMTSLYRRIDQIFITERYKRSNL